MSHSHVLEWILGSRIQSHWPWRMLWPISMLSRILATLRPAVPTTQAGGNALKSSTAREPSSSLRWVSISLRMYAASSAPRSSRMSWRMASSSTPICLDVGLGEVGDRVWACFWIVVMSDPSVLGGRGRSRASLIRWWEMGQWSMWQGPAAALMQVWTLIGAALAGDAVVMAPLRRSRTLPSLQRQHAAHADAHPAPAGHQDAGVLGGVEDRRWRRRARAWCRRRRRRCRPRRARRGWCGTARW